MYMTSLVSDLLWILAGNVTHNYSYMLGTTTKTINAVSSPGVVVTCELERTFLLGLYRSNCN